MYQHPPHLHFCFQCVSLKVLLTGPVLTSCCRNDESELIQLVSSQESPKLERRATLPKLVDSISSHFTRLHGDLVCIQSRRLIYLWNWRENTRGLISQHDGAGKVRVPDLSIVRINNYSFT